MIQSPGEIIRKAETDYTHGTTHMSKYVDWSMHEVLETIDAYLNSKHISGEQDALMRDKPFFNIVTAAVNVWFRATDIDTKDIKLIATKSKDWIDSFMATAHLRDWMRRARFGSFLNDWGRSLARYGSSVVKFVENQDGLFISVVPWNRIICDTVDFDANPKIEVIELTEAELYERIDTHGYDAAQVKLLCDAVKERETLDRQRKDNKSGYIKLYEMHANLQKACLTKKEGVDENIYFDQVHVISYVGKKNGRKTDYQDFTLYAGREKKGGPYMITHLIAEDGRTLSIGAVEHLFQAQWMVNHSMKAVKDTLDLSSKLVFQTADAHFVGRNILTEMEVGDVFLHGMNMPLTKVDTSKADIVGMSNYAMSWKNLGNEIAGISESMLGINPPSGTAWRQTEALLAESHSLFEIMTENKGLAITDMLTDRIIPYIKRKKLATADEIATTLDGYDIQRLDGIYIKKKALVLTNTAIKKKVLKGQLIGPTEIADIQAAHEKTLQDGLNGQGNQRFFVPDDLSDKTWKEQFKDLEWELIIDVTDESNDTKAALATLNTALQTIVNPAFAQNKKAQAVVGKILELTGAMSPVEYNAIPSDAPPVPSIQPLLPGQSQPVQTGGL